MTLTEQDKQSSLWRKLKDRAEHDLDALRKRNDAPNDEVTTALLRGRIHQIKELLALDKPVPEKVADEDE